MASQQLAPTLQALFVTFLWSTSWVLIKLGLEDLPPLTFAGLRYTLAAVVLSLWAVVSGRLSRLRLDARSVGWLVGLGVVMYTATQGAQFLALELLPAATVSLVLSFTPAVVALTGIGLLGERVGPGQWMGMGAMILGASLFLWPVEAGARAGLLVAATGTVANAAAALLGRAVNRRPGSDPFTVTLVSMSVGALLLLGVGTAVEPPPQLSPRGWGIIAWLAVVNTAGAFTLWNHTLRRLTATQSAVINNTMLVQIAVLAWIFLGERLDGRQISGLLVVALGAGVVQLRRRLPQPTASAVGGTGTPPDG